MTIRTRGARVCPGKRKECSGVIEDSAGPRRRGVTHGTVRGECGCYVIRVGGLVIARQMA